MGKRVLIFQPTRYLGDFLLTLPVLRAAKEAGATPILLSHGKFTPLADFLGVEVIHWDKDGSGKGLRGMADVAKRIK
ncbi:MAG: hypothetical protein ACPL68_07245, partial [Candidatus Hydrothermia bacterium]